MTKVTNVERFREAVRLAYEERFPEAKRLAPGVYEVRVPKPKLTATSVEDLLWRLAHAEQWRDYDAVWAELSVRYQSATEDEKAAILRSGRDTSNRLGKRVLFGLYPWP